ncbi:type II secretion system F family protein [Candidatus Dojkabacteria bacterium]|nr:type II secretion system F family protein [Candidatus Dojkabacteria bacterium]
MAEEEKIKEEKIQEEKPKKEKPKKEVPREKLLKKLQGVKVSVPNLLVSIKSLASLLKAGIPLSETMETIAGQSSDQNLNAVYEYIAGEVRKGVTLAEAMKLFPKVFPETISSVVEAGEQGGSLEQNLIFISDTIKKEWEINKKLKGAIIYPIIIVSMVFMVFLAMIFIVFPKLEVMFATFENIPTFTKTILSVAKYIRTNWYFIFGGIGVLVVLFIIFLKTKPGKRFKGWLGINFPILKNLFINNILSSFSRTLSVLLASGIPIAKSMKIAANTTSNYIYAEVLEEVYKSIEAGDSLSLSLGKHPKYFNKSFIKMVEIGEASGSLEDNLMYLHEYYAEEVGEMSANIVTVVEPVLLILVGLIIGSLVVTILMPIYQLMGSING